MILVRDHFRVLANGLLNRAQQAGVMGHAATVGSLRELVVAEFLRPLLPRHFEIKSGVIIDSTGARSRQQDIIIVDSRMPLIDVGSPDEAVVIAESVIATMEVKSNLTGDELRTSLESCVLTKSLRRGGYIKYAKGPVEMQVHGCVEILTYLFAFDGIQVQRAADRIHEFAWGDEAEGRHPSSDMFDAICVLGKGAILNASRIPVVAGNVVQLPALQEPEMTFRSLPQDALYAFSSRLCADITYLSLHGIDLDPYFTGEELA